MNSIFFSPLRRRVSLGLLAAAWMASSTSVLAQPGHVGGLAPLDDLPALVATVARADAPVAARARACQLLSLTDSKEAIPALAPLLTDPVLGFYARTALEGIPGPAALDALRAALSTTSGNQRLGVINSLGVRADTKASPALVAIARDATATGAAEALIALARIATPEAVPVIRQQLAAEQKSVRAAAADAAVRLAAVLAGRGDVTTAAALCDEAQKADVPVPLRLAGLRGSILARGDAGLPALLGTLRGTDRAAASMALRVARELPGPAVSRALAAELGTVPPEIVPPLIGALADRGDRSVRGAVEAMAVSPASEVRLASVEALGRIGDVSSVPVLVRVLGSETAVLEADAAVASLVRLPRGGVDDALLEALRQARQPALARVMSAIAQRGTKGGADVLLQHATGADATVARAAFDALGATATVPDLPRLMKAAGALSDPAVRDRAERALHFVVLQIPEPGRRTAAAVEGLRASSTPAARGSWLQVLGMLGDKTAAEAVANAYADPAPEVQETALQLLSHWSDTAAVPPLLRIFKTTPDASRRAAALQGLVTLLAPSEATAKNATPPSVEVVGWVTEMAAAIRPEAEERRILVSGLGDLNCREGLRLLTPYLEDPALRVPAAEALLRMAPRLADAEDKAAARGWVVKIAEAEASGAELRRKATELLPKLGP
ncbi:MAG: HEAT repeat domain-containing protein [Verrucomicrobiales bacterium]|nr:HEAT repeat domain-containing protein [Verrucomicrobiales bacterium]